ncbi:hypothetical protein BJF79_06075 [Actinomadura sp. CNU-125]|uniref:DUF4190 domain-containing protein n=1 Tax=Actinomadura sp. CNU-125 TaxID=1904961 RepID=UPI000962FD37|nr:DUF4190 domain-containing protein [Actinomadura sp. CNU-125]OLT36954.1 hypothetical protein BJF79_06075 [Actinomadura sp. CNU-125]
MTTPPDADSVDESPVQSTRETVHEALDAGAPDAAGPPRANRLAITALVTGLLGIVPVAIAFGVAALVRTRRGRGLAIGGLAAALAWAMAWTAVVVLIVTVSPADNSSSDTTTQAEKVHLSTLEAGDCYTWFGNEVRTALVDARPCNASHRGEVVALVPVGAAGTSAEPAPSRETAEALCSEKATHLATSTFFEDLDVYVHVLEPGSENAGSVSCSVHYTGAGVLQSPLAETLEKGRTSYRDLRIGMCVENRPEDDVHRWLFDSVKTAPCTEPHLYQVYATFDVPYQDGDPDWIPSDEYIAEKSGKGCEARLWDSINEVPGREYAVVPLMPTSSSWERQRETVCLVGLPGGTPLKKSIVRK